MIPRVPSATNLRSPVKRRSQCNALAFDVGHMLQQEATVEGVLHVSAAQAHSCMERFEDLQSLSAPALPALEKLLAASSADTPFTSPAANSPVAAAALSSISSASEQALQAAFCLATPPDNPTEDNTILRQPVSTAARTQTRTATSNSSSPAAVRQVEAIESSTLRRMPGRTPSSSNLLVRELEEAVQLEVAAAAAATESSTLSSSKILQTANAVARHRRRKLLRLLRSTQEAGQHLLDAWQSSEAGVVLVGISSSLARLASISLWDKADAGDSMHSSTANDNDGWIAYEAHSDEFSHDDGLAWFSQQVHGASKIADSRGCKFERSAACAHAQ